MLKDFTEKLSEMEQTPEIVELHQKAEHLRILFNELSLLEPNLLSDNIDTNNLKIYLDKFMSVYEKVESIILNN